MQVYKHRYPGPQPFNNNQGKLFFGREEDIENLYQLVSLEKLVVLFSKSGLGKSSLINAGIIPKLEINKQPAPIQWRFGAYTEGRLSPTDNVFDYLESQAAPSQLLKKAFGDEASFWIKIKAMQLNSGLDDFLIIIDQFEELFTYPDELIEAFKIQISDLLFTEIPNKLRQNLESHFDSDGKSPFTEEELELIHKPFNTRMLLAIRSDRMSLLNNLKDYLPGVLQTCYELSPLNRTQAEEAILNPAFLNDSSFLSPPFDYEDEAIESLLSFLEGESGIGIASFQLQLLCQHLEQKVLAEGLSKISQIDLGQLETIFENYYETRIKMLANEEEQQAARLLLEEALIYEKEKRRLSLYEGQIYQSYGFSPELLRKLSEYHLLRAEPSLKGGYTYEIPHDTLVAPILRAKKRRVAKEKAQKEKAQKEAQEKALQTLKLELEEIKQKRRRARLIATLTSILTLLAIISTITAFRQSERAKKAEVVAVEEKENAEDLSNQLRSTLGQVLQANYDQYLAQGNQYLSQWDFAKAKEVLDLALNIDTVYLTDKGNGAKTAMLQYQEKSKSAEQYTKLIEEGRKLAEGSTEAWFSAKEKFTSAKKLNLDENANQAAQNELDALRLKMLTEAKQLKTRALLLLGLPETSNACDLLKTANRLNPKDKETSEALNSNCK